jgi:hypothetical protein
MSTLEMRPKRLPIGKRATRGKLLWMITTTALLLFEAIEDNWQHVYGKSLEELEADKCSQDIQKDARAKE